MKSSTVAKVKISAVLVIVIVLKTSLYCNSQKFFRKKSNFATMTAIGCALIDPSYVKVTKCILKPINRTLKYVDIKADLLKPFQKFVMIHFRILKKANGGYKPFGIEVTLDACKYLAGKKNPVYDWFHNMLQPYTNLNHTCPYDVQKDIIIKYPVTEFELPSVFPEGEYRMIIQFGADGHPRVAAYASVALREDYVKI